MPWKIEQGENVGNNENRKLCYNVSKNNTALPSIRLQLGEFF